MDLHKCIEQYFSSTPPSKWDIPTLAKEASQVHPKPSKGASVGTLRDRLEKHTEVPALEEIREGESTSIIEFSFKGKAAPTALT